MSHPATIAQIRQRMPHLTDEDIAILGDILKAEEILRIRNIQEDITILKQTQTTLLEITSHIHEALIPQPTAAP